MVFPFGLYFYLNAKFFNQYQLNSILVKIFTRRFTAVININSHFSSKINFKIIIIARVSITLHPYNVD